MPGAQSRSSTSAHSKPQAAPSYVLSDIVKHPEWWGIRDGPQLRPPPRSFLSLPLGSGAPLCKGRGGGSVPP